MLNQGGWQRAFPQQLPPVLRGSSCRHSSQALLGKTTAGEGQDSSLLPVCGMSPGTLPKTTADGLQTPFSPGLVGGK